MKATSYNSLTASEVNASIEQKYVYRINWKLNPIGPPFLADIHDPNCWRCNVHELRIAGQKAINSRRSALLAPPYSATINALSAWRSSSGPGVLGAGTVEDAGSAIGLGVLGQVGSPSESMYSSLSFPGRPDISTSAFVGVRELIAVLDRPKPMSAPTG